MPSPLLPRTFRAAATADRCAQLRADADARAHLHARAAVARALRAVFEARGHIEVDTPLLHLRPTAGAQPFRVMSRHLDPDTFLRACPLHLRAMLTAGFAKVYEIGRTFRDETPDATHAVEYTLVEAYAANADYHDTRTLVRDLVHAAALAAVGATNLPLPDGTRVELADTWGSVRIHDAVGVALGRPVTPGTPPDELRRAAAEHDVPTRAADADGLVLELYDALVEPATHRPTFHTHFPADTAPLAETCPKDRRLAHKWDLVIGGREIATSYSELTNPAELRRRLTPRHGAPSDEADTLDDGWLRTFGAGMPTTAAGLCIGLERLVMTLTGAADLTDAIPFPTVPPPRG
ncbi:amino acid--tRNA ligase-related protein [Streptodolium elevatio]